jgi:hypothetical protein
MPHRERSTPRARRRRRDEIREYWAERKFQTDVSHIVKCGPAVVGALLAELGSRCLIRTEIDRLLAKYAALDPDLIRALGGDVFPPRPPLRVISGGRA